MYEVEPIMIPVLDEKQKLLHELEAEIAVLPNYLKKLQQNTPQLPSHAIILTHPYSWLGGNMQNNVPEFLFEYFSQFKHPLQSKLACIVKFNFRGVGNSGGWKSLTGWNEREDVKAVVNFLVKTYHIQQVHIVGYSFGSAVASGVAQDLDVVKSVTAISYPKGMLAGILFSSHYSSLLHCTKPKLFLLGDSDNFASASSFEKWLQDHVAQPTEFHLIENLDHFWFGKENLIPNYLIPFLQKQMT